jgi:nitrogen-specific signal transduction histidine kinase
VVPLGHVWARRSASRAQYKVAFHRAPAAALYERVIRRADSVVHDRLAGRDLRLSNRLQDIYNRVGQRDWDRPGTAAASVSAFYKLDSGLARRHEGAGLGLALARRLVQLQGGSLHVHGTPGKGSRFTVTLPWIEE